MIGKLTYHFRFATKTDKIRYTLLVILRNHCIKDGSTLCSYSFLFHKIGKTFQKLLLLFGLKNRNIFIQIIYRNQCFLLGRQCILQLTGKIFCFTFCLHDGLSIFCFLLILFAPEVKYTGKYSYQYYYTQKRNNIFHCSALFFLFIIFSHHFFVSPLFFFFFTGTMQLVRLPLLFIEKMLPSSDKSSVS